MKQLFLLLCIFGMGVGSVYSDTSTSTTIRATDASICSKGPQGPSESPTVVPMDSYKHRPKSLTPPPEAEAELVYHNGYVYFRFLNDLGYAEATISGMDQQYEYSYTFATSLEQPEYVGMLHGSYQVTVETHAGNLFGCVLTLE